jgi:hypothetical protein
MRGAAVVLVALAMVAAPAVVTGATEQAPGPDEAGEAACAPPCGEINPRISFSFPELDDKTIDLQKGESKTFEGTVTYWTQTDDEGYAPRDPQQPVMLQFSYPRLPAWAAMSAEPSQLEVPVNTCPQCFVVSDDDSRSDVYWEYKTNVTLTVEALEPPEATPGYDTGELQLFAMSTESGIYNPGYGIQEVSVNPAGDALEEQSSDGDGATVPGPGPVAALAALAGLAALVRRRSA